MSAGEVITKDDWLRRAAQRFVEKAGLPQAEADAHAALLFESLGYMDRGVPEADADEEMSYWDDDEAAA